ncbi:hypothetical protein ANCCAN_28406 [Ancylostoma caninum]|uniref:Diphthine--ammonia ligase n=1 Tax=Ancylostoma caninum TaxID=29170 RepID=A0A368F4E8_ANCCA|nr:hypothetical protein ANCCAN_28406 [Ancylostoma caninum]
MEVVGLVSGGKDSCYNMMCAVKAGHRIVALANLHPDSPGELDSYMYQSVASEGIHMIAEAMDLPLYRREIKGKPLNQDFDYSVGLSLDPSPENSCSFFLILSVTKNTCGSEVMSSFLQCGRD